MLLKADDSLLFIVDVQENTINFINQHELLLANCKDLLTIAQAFEIPIMASEHMPETSGNLVKDLCESGGDVNTIAKQQFSAYEAALGNLHKFGRKQIVIAGLETHLCVLQTAMDLLAHDYQVFIVADATSSRFPEDKHFALSRLEQSGAEIITKQMALFEWAKSANNPAYQDLSRQMMK